jgi:hypothetical protein
MVSDYELIAFKLGLPDRADLAKEYIAHQAYLRRAADEKAKSDNDAKEQRLRENAYRDEFTRTGRIVFSDDLIIRPELGYREMFSDPVHEVPEGVLELSSDLQKLIGYKDRAMRDERRKLTVENAIEDEKSRKLKFDENQVARRRPHPSNYIAGLNVFVVDSEFARWTEMAVDARDHIYAEHGVVPNLPALLPIWDGVRGFQPILKVIFTEVVKTK